MTYRQLLEKHADFRRLWYGQVVSEIGDWLNNIAVLALTLDLAGPRRQGLAIAIYAIARHLPLFLFGPLAGVAVDRSDRRRVMIASDVLRSVLALGFMFAGRWGSLELIYIVGASLFAVSAFFNAAKRAAIPNIIGDPNELLSANSLSASTTAATIAVGSALGGLVATFVARDVVFILNAATFLVSAEMIRRIRRIPPHGHAESQGKSDDKITEQDDAVPLGRGARVETGIPAGNINGHVPLTFTRRFTASLFRSTGSLWLLLLRIGWAGRRLATDFLGGLQYVRSDYVLAAIFVVAAGWGLGNGAARALYSVFGAQLGEKAAALWLTRPKDFGISVLFVAMGLGGVAGAPVARRASAAAGRSLGARMGRSMIFDGCGLALFSMIPNLWGASVVLIAREMNFAVWWTAQQTIIMRRTDNAYAGRVFASFETITTLMMVGSMLVSGAAADAYGIKVVAGAGGACVALSGALWFLLRYRHRGIEEMTPAAARQLS